MFCVSQFGPSGAVTKNALAPEIFAVAPMALRGLQIPGNTIPIRTIRVVVAQVPAISAARLARSTSGAISSSPWRRSRASTTGAMCGDSVLVATRDDQQVDSIWRSTDGSSWSRQPAPAGLGAELEFGTPVLAGNERGAVAAARFGQSVAATSDCTTWQTSRLPGPGKFSLAAAAASDHGFAIVGYAVDRIDGILGPLAWWSSDGLAWNLGSTPHIPGVGLVFAAAANEGFVGSGAEIHVSPGVGTFWVATDGREWTQSTANPLGLQTDGAGIGSPADSFAGDGVRLIAFGRQGTDAAPEYWVSFTGTSWSRLALNGPGAAALLADPQVQAFPMRDGILFSGGSANDATTWFGEAVAR